ncbi:type 1 glutamine amidotransferase [Phytoactinopolyspora limicola]|uniref:type 1 glutamine amidotransferase n=1 Tax=Phytoactinopolyspora limicola TaxID=2715536 RepID=UPI001408EBB4
MTNQDVAASALVIQHTAQGGPRRLEEWWQAAGLRLDVVRAFEGAEIPDELYHDALVVLGGGYMPDDDTSAPWLRPTRSLVNQALDYGRPLFGVCLGAQMLALVSGGSVQADAGAPEHGSTPIRLRPEAADDPLFTGLPTVVPAIEHHRDAITALPAQATWLAATDRCPYQAFRVGASAWGVQFHPEVGPDRILQWDAADLSEQGFDRDKVHRQAVADDPVATQVWQQVAGRFARVVAGG